MRKIRVVVDMFGGIVEGVATDSPDVELDIVFLEDAKYGSDDPKEREFPVKKGPYKDRIVYTHGDVADLMKPEQLDPVFQAAARREKAK